jgi:hypothetical protein
MLHNLPILSNEELLHLFVSETKRFMSGLEKDIPYHDLREIKGNLTAVSAELDKRRKDGRLTDG